MMSRLWSRWAIRAVAAIVLTVAAGMVLLDTGPPSFLVAALDPDYIAGAPFESGELLVVSWPRGTVDVDALIAELEPRLVGVGTLVASNESSLTIAPSAPGALAKRALEQAVSSEQGRFEVLPIIETSPRFDAIRRFAGEMRDVVDQGPGLFSVETEASAQTLVTWMEARCEACRLGPDEAIYFERDLVVTPSGETAEERWTAELVSRAPPIFNERMLDDARLTFDDRNRPGVILMLTREGAERFAELSEANVGRRLAIVIDGHIQSSPVVKERIAGGELWISVGSLAPKEALAEGQELVARLRPGLNLPNGTALAWLTNAGASASAILWATILTLLGVAVTSWTLATLAQRYAPFVWAPARVGTSPLQSAGLVAIAWRVPLTLGLAATPYLLAQLPVPWVDTEMLPPGLHPSIAWGALGITPVLMASVLVYFVVWLAPPLKRFRDGSAARRRGLLPATAVLTLALCVLQGFGIVAYLRSLPELEFGAASGGLVLVSLAFGTFALWAMAALVSALGVANGLVVMVASPTVAWLFDPHSSPSASNITAMVLVGLAAVVIASLAVPSPTGARRLPLAGIVPLELLATVFTLLSLFATLWQGGIDAGFISYGAWLMVLPLLSILLAGLMARPLSWRAFVPAGTVSIAFIMAIPLLQHLVSSAAPDLMVAASYAAIPILAVCIADLVGEAVAWARLGPLVRVASTHDVDRAGLWLAALGSASVPTALRAARLRALLRFMGPWVPVEVLVPTARRDEALAALRAAADAELTEPF